MSGFIPCDDGLINAAVISRIRERIRQNAREIVFEDADGKIVAVDSFPLRDFLWETAGTIVPAAAGAAAFLITPQTTGDDSGGRPDSTFVEHVPIVAWRIVHGVGMPVLVERQMRCTRVFIIMPDGKLRCPDDAFYDSVGEAAAGTLDDAQREWDRTHRDLSK